MAISLVTGGAGFIGSHLIEALLARGYDVRVLDNFSTGVVTNIAPVLDSIDLIVGDVTDLDLVHQAVEGVDWIFHLAAPAEWAHGTADPEMPHSASVTGTRNVLVAARDAGVRRVVYASSGSIYGPAVPFPLGEERSPRPLSPYGVAKLTGEQDCITFTNLFGLETVRLRYFNVFGPRLTGLSPFSEIILQALKAMLFGRHPVIHGDGLNPQDFIYVDDVVHATLLAAEARRVAGRVYNIGRGRPTTALDIVSTLNAILGTHIQPIHTQPCPKGDLHNLADIRRSEAELGFCPSTDLEAGLRHCVESFGKWRDQLLDLRQNHFDERAASSS